MIIRHERLRFFMPDKFSRMKLKSIFFILFFAGIVPLAYTQKANEEDSLLLVKSRYFYVKSTDIAIQELFHPTYDQTHIHLSDPLQQMDNNYYARMQNVGQSHLNLFYKPRFSSEFVYQPSTFESYLFRPQNVKFFQLEKPYTELQYFGGLNEEYLFNVTHSQNIFPNWNIAVEDHLTSAPGYYAHSNVLDNYLSATSHFFTKNGRYHVRAGFIYNRSKIDENGGITTDSLFTQNLQTTRDAIPVNLTSAKTSVRDMEAFAYQNFVLQKFDTTLGKGNPFNLGAIGLNLQWHKQTRAYIDNNPNSGYYQQILIDSTRTFDSVRTQQFNNSVFWTNDIYVDHRYKNPVKLTLGLNQQYVNHTDSISRNEFWGFAPFAQLKLAIAGFSLGASAEYNIGSGYNSNDARFEASMRYSLPQGKLTHEFSVKANIQALQPDYFYAHYYGNNYQWENPDLKKEQLQRLEVRYELKNWFWLGGIVNNLTNAVYLNENISPVQHTGTEQLYQAYLGGKVKWNILRFENYTNLQYASNEDVFRLPLLELKQSLYVEFPLFKKVLLLQTGLDLNYNTKYYADAYSPALAAFYRQNEIELGNHVWLDVFISAQLKRAFLFAKFTHVNALFDSAPNYFMIPHYPTQDFGFRWGFVWKFFD